MVVGSDKVHFLEILRHYADCLKAQIGDILQGPQSNSSVARMVCCGRRFRKGRQHTALVAALQG